MAQGMKLTIDGIAYTAVILAITVIDFLGFQGPIELQLKIYADQEYYAPLHPYEAMHLGDINEDIISHLAMAGNTASAKIEIAVI